MKELKPARRLDEIKEYYFSKKLREVAEMNARGLDVISLGVGGPDRPPHENVRRRLKAPTATSLTWEPRNLGRIFLAGIKTGME